MEQISLSYKTRGNTSPRGKSRVYFSYHPEDALYFEHTADLILSKLDCAVYYYDYGKNGEPDKAALAPLLEEMQLFVIPVTAKLLNRESLALSFELPFALEHRIPVLPLLQSGDLAEQFNLKCGNLQYLDEFSEDKTAISFSEKLDRFLYAALISPETIEKIQAAFDAYVFLSYRKKDREYAQKLMRLIHRHPALRDVAIWYDEFLTAGEPFDCSIEEALKKSDVFALLVTPNLINEKNYVADIEFPTAKEAGKEILAAESVPVDYRKLREIFVGIPECVDAADERLIPKELLHKLRRLAVERNNTPEHNFLIGLAYLNGIDLERNADLALEMITGAADGGLPEASEKLADMYYSGVGVKRNIESAVLWQKKYTEHLKKEFEKSASTSTVRNLFLARLDLARYYAEASMTDDAEAAYLENLELVREAAEQEPEEFTELWLAACGNIGSFYFEQGRFAAAEEHMRKAAKKAVLYAQNGAVSYLGIAASCCHNLAQLYITLSRLPEAEKCILKASELEKRLSSRENAPNDAGAAESDILLGGIYLEQNRLPEAKERYLAALSGLEPLCKAQPSVYGAALAVCCINTGYFYYVTQNFEESEKCYLKGIDLLEQLALKNPQRYCGKLASAYNNLGTLYSDIDRNKEAKDCLMNAALLHKSLASENPEKYCDSLATDFNNLGHLFYFENRLEDASHYWQSALRLREALAEDEPEAYNTALAVSCTNMGLLSAERGMLKEALEFYIRAIGLYEGANSPETHSESLAVCYNRAGSVYYQLDELDKAAEYLRKGTALWETLFRDEPERFATELANSYHNMAHICRICDRDDLANAYLKNETALRENFCID